jgi:FtsP/CotA-like multicopper oxidase with cupredoxin domain
VLYSHANERTRSLQHRAKELGGDADRRNHEGRGHVMVGGYQEVAVDFLADNPAPTLFHCHQQLHMDFGFMTLFEYA